MEPLKDIVVLYHGNCTDGFGAAWAVWKKLGETASYLPQDRKEKLDANLLRDKEVYVVDYSFSLEEMLEHQKLAKRYVVIDHHSSAQENVTKLKEYVFDLNYSGAYLAWQYFHPNIEVPKLIAYISDSDTWAHKLPDWETVEPFVYYNTPDRFSFAYFDKLYVQLEDIHGFDEAKKVGAMFKAQRDALIDTYVNKAELISFEGYDIYAVNAPSEVRSEVGAILAEKTNSFALIFYYEPGTWKCSLRSVKDFDVVPIAEKFGGGGHKNAAAFYLTASFPITFT